MLSMVLFSGSWGRSGYVRAGRTRQRSACIREICRLSCRPRCPAEQGRCLALDECLSHFLKDEPSLRRNEWRNIRWLYAVRIREVPLGPPPHISLSKIESDPAHSDDKGELQIAQSTDPHDRNGGSSTMFRRKRRASAATGSSGHHFGASELQRHLAGAEHCLLESGKPFHRGPEQGFLAARRNRRHSSG
jgi:hypothetical protein